MVMKLYWDPIPPPCQAVLLTARYLGIELQLHRINVMKSEQKSAEFVRVSRLQQVPVLEEEDGFRLTESRAIMTYLARRAGAAGAALLPAEPRAHALCLQWMWFDVTCLWYRLKCCHLPVVTRQAGQLCAAALPPLREALQVLDEQLRRTTFVCSETLSLADLGLVTSVAQTVAIGIEIKQYSGITTWYERLGRDLPYLEATVEGSRQYAGIIQQLMHDWPQQSEHAAQNTPKAGHE